MGGAYCAAQTKPANQMKTKTIFRTFHTGGDVIAIFPEIPADRAGDFCESYMHTGQHGAASPDLARQTRPATPGEVYTLARELEAIGYTIEARKRVSFTMHRTRRAAALA